MVHIRSGFSEDSENASALKMEIYGKQIFFFPLNEQYFISVIYVLNCEHKSIVLLSVSQIDCSGQFCLFFFPPQTGVIIFPLIFLLRLYCTAELSAQIPAVEMGLL